MRRIIPALMLGLSASLPAPCLAVELDSATDLLLRCGSAYVLMATDPQVVSSEEEATNMRSIGEALIVQADAQLSGLGADVAEREKIGQRIAMDVATALANDTDPGFKTDQCTALILKDNPEAAKAVDVRNNEIDKLMTCGVVFRLVAQAAKDDEDPVQAAEYEGLGNKLISRADGLMVESGMSEQSRHKLGALYGEQVAKSIKAGEALNYDWDTCAQIDG